MTTVLEKKDRTAGILTPKPRIRAIVNEWGYQIIDVETKEILSEAGNNPRDSSTTQNLLPGHGAADIVTLREWAAITGKCLAGERDTRWWGVQEGEFV